MSQDTTQNNKRIAKNTIALYFRMFLIMGVSLYTSRVILSNLGIEDFGIYNIVGGIIVLFAFINNAMITTTQRFLNFELGKKDLLKTNKVFSMSLNVHILIAVIIVLVSETLGLYIFYNYLKIPEDRLYAAEIVYQLSILTTVFNIFRAPYNACIIAYERMSVYAYLSIFEAIAKLIVAFILVYGNFDRLILYAILMTCISISIFIFYYSYSIRKFQICKYYRFWDKELFKQLTSFSGWSLFGSLATTGAFQGVSIVQNYFGGVIVNASMGIANQVNSAIYSFTSNFQMAFNPQITKYYASGDKINLNRLTFMATKTSFFLVWILSFPIIVFCNEILELWLMEVPEYAVIFCRLILLNSLFDAVSAPLWMNVQATGKIKTYQIIVSLIIIINLPLSIFVLFIGLPAESVLIVRIIVSFILILYRSIYLYKVGLIKLKEYFIKSIFPCFEVLITSFLIGIIIINTFNHYIINSILIFFTTLILVFHIGFSKEERNGIITILKNRK